MSTRQAIELDDLRGLAEEEAPELVEAILAYAEQEEPSLEPQEVESAEALTLDSLRDVLRTAGRLEDKRKKQQEAREAWQRYLSQPQRRLAPAILLADFLEALYDKNTAGARRAILQLAAEAPLNWGLWGGLKRLFKRAEAAMDAEVFGALAARFDVAASSGDQEDVGKGTLIYLQRRGWRFLRRLGRSNPELYPQFAVEVLRNYPAETRLAHTLDRILNHHSVKWGGPRPAKNKKFRPAFLDAWKADADPLLLLLETCQTDAVATFAIQGLRELFPEVLRKVTPQWLARLVYRPIESAHQFLVETLEGSPEYHQGKLVALGLHDAVMELMLSPSSKARKYAIEYTRGHGADTPTERVLDWLDRGDYSDTTTFLVQLLMARGSRTLGVNVLARMLVLDASSKWAAAALENDFDRKEISFDFLVEMLLSEHYAQARWAQRFLEKKYKLEEIPTSFWIRVLDDPRLEDAYHDPCEFALEKLRKTKIEEVPGDWLLKALARDDIGSEITQWLRKARALPPSLELERLKGLVFDPDKRGVVFAVLGNTKLVPPATLGVGWLLALARRADPELHQWAQAYLLQHLAPSHFAEAKGGTTAGIDRLFALATGAREPETIRLFAQAYLRCHHPEIGKDQPETKLHGIKPQVAREAYTLERVWPALSDLRADVRRFAVAITRVELRRWGAQSRVYELADSAAKEVRNLAYDALLQAGDPQADPNLALKPEELDAAQIFSMTESRKPSSRVVAMDLIRAHYARLGGAERLGWLMQSADPEVRLFAVRLLWEKHRPRGLPSQWKPPKGRLEDAGPFQDAAALRALLRRLLFTIPASGSGEKTDHERTRRLSPSVAKRHVIELVRDLGIQDAAFAELVAPVLGEFTGSVAKGEWQHCLSALMTLRAKHGLTLEGLV